MRRAWRSALHRSGAGPRYRPHTPGSAAPPRTPSASGRLDQRLKVEEIVLQAKAVSDRRRVREVTWPRDAVIASVRRGGQMLIPHGDTLLKACDVLVVVAEGEARAEMQRLCQGD